MIARAVVFVAVAAAAALLAGCSTGSAVGDMLLYGPVGGLTVYGNGQNAKMVAEGRYPPPELRDRCRRDALVRDAAGQWVTDRTRLAECYAAAGWKYEPDFTWSRIPAPAARSWCARDGVEIPCAEADYATR